MRSGQVAGLALVFGLGLVPVVWGQAASAATEADRPADAQAGTPTEPPQPTTPAATGATPPEEVVQPRRRLGRYRIGPLYLTPSIQVGTIGLDSNVNYSSSDPRADLTASAGPALKTVLPIWRSLQLEGMGSLQYLYFARTTEQRRFTGLASGGASWAGLRTGASAEYRYQRERRRPSFEVDRRVLWTTTGVTANLWRTLFARTRLTVKGEDSRQEVDEGEVHLGVDLRETLSQRTQSLGVDLDYGLTVKTSIAVVADRTQHRFLFAEGRDADADRAMAGLRTDTTALVSGHALVGVQQYRPRSADLARRQVTAWDVHATLNISPRTHLGGSVFRGLSFSALASLDAAPLLLTDAYGLHLDKDLYFHLNLRVTALRQRLANDGRLAAEGEVSSPDVLRHDTADQIGADLGYVFRTRLRLGVAATYTTRRSNISYFGVEGLLVGFSVQFAPPLP